VKSDTERVTGPRPVVVARQCDQSALGSEKVDFVSDQLHEFWIADDDDQVTCNNLLQSLDGCVLKFNGQTSCSRATYPGHSISQAPRGWAAGAPPAEPA